MSCAGVQADLSLYLYGELDFAREEWIESHLEGCALCQLALSREKEWHAAVKRQQIDVRPEWLAECRRDLHQQIATAYGSSNRIRSAISGWLRNFDLRINERSYRLAAVSFLLLVGFAAGRMVNSFPVLRAGESISSAGLIGGPTTRVQEIRPEKGNRVRIILQQVQVREVSGSRYDDGMRSLLVGAARESVDPGVRLDSVEMLAGETGIEIRNALADTVKSDPNAAVRMKAIQSLGQFPSDAVTRGVLEFALAHDRDAGVRAIAMDALVPAQGDFQMTPQLMQTISNVMRQSEQSDDYVRFRCAQILNEHASFNANQ